jgi:signal transduction histidine kinase
MLGYAELMREGTMGPTTLEQIEVLDRMLLNGRGLLELINMTLDVSRLEAGRVTVDVSAFSINALLAELHNEFSIAGRPEVEVRWPVAVADPELYLDRGKLKLVLRNLVDNALKFTRRGSVAVEVETDLEGDRIRISVVDTGVGIPPEALPSVFEMFHQLDGARSSRAGVGLGLYLVRRYTELMGGRIAVESTVGVGSVFTADLPRRLDRHP